jgi:hypothetical protein
MANTIEPAASGRAKCRGCGERIAKGELRLGARLPNPFVEGELTLWFHLDCGAFKRPEPYLDAAGATKENVPNAERLEAQAKLGLEHRRLPRLNGAERAPSGRALCRSCRTAIDKGSWRISLVFYDEEEGRFNPGGFIHPQCAQTYFGTRDVIDRIRRFSPALTADELEAIGAALDQPPPTTE